MITQEVRARKLGALEGVLLIVIIVAGVFAAMLAANWLSARRNALWGQLGVWLIVILLALYLMRNLIVRYQYTVSGDQFYIERVMGARSHVMMQLPVSDVLFIGTEAEVAEKYPGARIMASAVLRDYPRPVCFMAYTQDKNTHLAKLQLNDELIGALTTRA